MLKSEAQYRKAKEVADEAEDAARKLEADMQVQKGIIETLVELTTGQRVAKHEIEASETAMNGVWSLFMKEDEMPDSLPDIYDKLEYYLMMRQKAQDLKNEAERVGAAEKKVLLSLSSTIHCHLHCDILGLFELLYKACRRHPYLFIYIYIYYQHMHSLILP